MNEKPPIKEGEVYTGIVENVGEKGDGVLRVKGFVIFIPGVEKGDYIKIKATKVLAKVAFGELVEKLDRPKKEAAFIPRKPEPKGPAPEIVELMTTKGDSEDFGEDDDEED